MSIPGLNLKEILAQLGPVFAARAAQYDASDSFADENYHDLRAAGVFSAVVPVELGGAGVSYTEICRFVREIGRCCGSTALALSMHQHVLSAAVWNYRHGRPGEKLLRRVAERGAVLVSTGAADWLGSSGTLTQCHGGYRFSGRKMYASACLAGDLLVTSGRYEDPANGLQVLHFAVPMSAEGISIDRIWKTMGMRASGSHTVVLDNVFVPEESVTIRRPCGKFHAGLNVSLPIALPLVSAAYVGVAEAAAELVRAGAARKGDDGVRSLLLGEMENELTIAQLSLESAIANANDLDFEIGIARTSGALVRKTIIAEALTRLAAKAMEATAGEGYFRASEVERMVRDLAGVRFHSPQPKKQQRFTGRVAMGLEPADD